MRVIIMTLLGSENYLQNELQRRNSHELQADCWKMARPAGFEPATYRLEGGCSNPLSYGRLSAHNTTLSLDRAPLRRYDGAMTDQATIAKIGQTIWGPSWQGPMAAALKQQHRTIEDWSSGRVSVPLEAWKELREAARQQYLKLADLDAEIVRAFDAAYQRAMAGKR
jgi:hypothetical protein